MRLRGESGARFWIGARAPIGLLIALVTTAHAGPAAVPPSERGSIDAERVGTHDAANIRTRFWNFGMVGDYPPDPVNVDLSVFHSAEVPKGTGMNYSDGITPFVLARVNTEGGGVAYIMETGFRERQARLGPPFPETAQMRFEPRPGFFEPDPAKNRGRSPAISNDPRTWPAAWPDKLQRHVRSGLARLVERLLRQTTGGGSGELHRDGRRSLRVRPLDVSRRLHRPDARRAGPSDRGSRVPVGQSAGRQRHLLALRHHQREHHRLRRQHRLRPLHGLGVGGSAVSCDGIAESDDDNAFFDRSLGLNLVYTWDKNGRGRDLSGPCGRTGYLGLRLPRDAGESVRRSRQRLRRRAERAARRRPGRRDRGTPGDPRPCRRQLRHRPFVAVLWTDRQPARVPLRARGGPATRTWTGSRSSTTSARMVCARPGIRAREI